MSSSRFSMNFHNGNTTNALAYSNMRANIATAPKPRIAAAPITINSALNAPMIGRVHKAKPGCSACGKKVA